MRFDQIGAAAALAFGCSWRRDIVATALAIPQIAVEYIKGQQGAGGHSFALRTPEAGFLR
jgi:hypothetical protein